MSKDAPKRRDRSVEKESDPLSQNGGDRHPSRSGKDWEEIQGS